jgi:16S rRNA (adenine1518-N6/adenine1519-N6)-dimethyltransferase
VRLGDLRALLESHGLRPNPRFGQNFLVDPALLAAIPVDAGVRAGERVLEVGPGAGALTAELLAAGAQVLAVEVDHGLAGLLRGRFAEALADGRLALLECDVLAAHERYAPAVEEWWAAGPPPRLVANLPYQISGPFLGRLPGRPLSGATLLLQREVARKACGLDDGWSPLGVRLALAFHARVGRRLPPEVFWPRPQVESAFLHLEPRAGAPDAAADRLLAGALKVAYGQRRKRALPRLRREAPAWAEALLAVGVGEQARAEEISPETWHQALHALS